MNKQSKINKDKNKMKLVKETCYKPEAMHDMMHEPMTLNIGSINAWAEEVIMHEYLSAPTVYECFG